MAFALTEGVGRSRDCSRRDVASPNDRVVFHRALWVPAAIIRQHSVSVVPFRAAMIGLEMQGTKEKSVAAMRLELDRFEYSGTPSDVERAFACQLATSVWLLQLGDADARKALFDYVQARHGNRRAQARLRVALESEYRLCRERLDLCS